MSMVCNLYFDKKKTNDFYKCTKILVWFSGSVDFISSGAIVYGVIDIN